MKKTNYFTKVIAFLFSKRTVMFLFFLIIAFVVWFISRLADEYRASLKVNVCVYSSTNENTPRLCSEETIPIVGRTNGFNIIRQRMATPPVVYVDIKNQSVRKLKSRYYMLTATLQNEIIQQLSSNDIKVEYCEKDTVFFSGVALDEFPNQMTINGDPIY